MDELQEDEKLQDLDKKGRRSKHCSAGLEEKIEDNENTR
jgi:hypothetical protein